VVDYCISLIRQHAMAWTRAVLVLAVLLLPAVVAAQSSGVPAYRLGANDKVKVTVFGETDLSGEFQISGSGVLAMPLVGQVDVGGMTTTEAEGRLAQRLSAGILKNPKVSVEVLTYRPFYILGEVNNPGSYAYVNGMSVLNAAAMGGGFTYRADKKDIKIRRIIDGEKRELKAGADAVVQPGDVIEVGERFF
jgi:protein involved in polysaccharide export with SLBB domain